MTIQDMYHVQPIKHATSSLERWYNRLIAKGPEEMTDGDILRSLRQGVFTDLAEKTLIVHLRADVFAGEMNDGELLESLANMPSSIIAKYSEDVKEIVATAESSVSQHEWCNQEEINNYLESLAKIKKISQNTQVHT
jgi:hypothetical protein